MYKREINTHKTPTHTRRLRLVYFSVNSAGRHVRWYALYEGYFLPAFLTFFMFFSITHYPHPQLFAGPNSTSQILADVFQTRIGFIL